MDETCAQDDVIEDIRAKVTMAMEEAKAAEEKPKLEKVFRKRLRPESEEEIDDAVSLVSEHLHLQTPEKKRNKR